MYAQATRPQFRQRGDFRPFLLHTPRGRKGLQKGLHAKNEKCDCIKYLKLGEGTAAESRRPMTEIRRHIVL